MKRGVLWLLVLPVFTGCATRYCERGAQMYQDSVEQATLQAPDGLRVPAPDPNFSIPEATGENVPYATTVTDASGRASSNCLDAPPALSVSASPAIEPLPEAGEEPDPLPATEAGEGIEPAPAPGEP